MSEITILTNNHPRLILEAYELSATERAEFDYIDWPAMERGEDSASFIRYRGVTYDLGDFQVEGGMMKGSSLPSAFAGWDGFASDSFFSGVLVKFCPDDTDRVIMGRYFS